MTESDRVIAVVDTYAVAERSDDLLCLGQCLLKAACIGEHVRDVELENQCGLKVSTLHGIDGFGIEGERLVDGVELMVVGCEVTQCQRILAMLLAVGLFRYLDRTLVVRESLLYPARLAVVITQTLAEVIVVERVFAVELLVQLEHLLGDIDGTLVVLDSSVEVRQGSQTHSQVRRLGRCLARTLNDLVHDLDSLAVVATVRVVVGLRVHDLERSIVGGLEAVASDGYSMVEVALGFVVALGYIQAVTEVSQRVNVRVHVHLVLTLEHINSLVGILDGFVHTTQCVVAVHLVGIDIV